LKKVTQIMCEVSVLLFIFVMGYAAGAIKPAPITDIENSETFVATVTAYCPYEKCCGDSADGITANGHKIRPGERFCAADRRFAFGTMLDIPGYGRVPVLDRGGAIKGDKLDVYFDSHAEALHWGVRKLPVRVIER
jgi:3D (Asp-Asp-Asp) domain-containing protein